MVAHHFDELEGLGKGSAVRVRQDQVIRPRKDGGAEQDLLHVDKGLLPTPRHRWRRLECQVGAIETEK